MARRLILWLALAAALLAPSALRAETATTVDKNLSQNVTTQGAISSNVSLSAREAAEPVAWADARGEVYEGLEGNVVVETEGTAVAHISDSFSGAAGIVSINQSPGNSNNQGNVVSFAYVEAPTDTAVMAGGAAEVVNRDNALEATQTVRSNIIEGAAFQDFHGALQINQSAGSLNNQNNIVCVASGAHGVVALSEAALGQQVARNSVQDMGVLKKDVLGGQAFSGASGLISINQSSGCGNNQTNLVVISVQQLN